MSALSDTARFRRSGTVFSLLAAGILIFAGVITSPESGSESTAEYLRTLADNAGSTQISAVLLHFGYLLLVPSTFGLVALLHSRAVALGHVALMLSVLGTVSLAGNVLVDVYDLAIAQNLSQTDAVGVVEAAEGLGAAGAFMVPAFFGTVIGLTLMAIALWRAEQVPGAVAGLMPVAWIGFFALPIAGATILLAVLALLARYVARSAGRVGPARLEPAAA